MAGRFISAVRSLFEPRVHRVVINRIPLDVRADETVLDGALRHGLAFPHSCKVGGCGACKCRLLGGRVRRYGDPSYLLTKHELAQQVILACQSAPRSDIEIEVETEGGCDAAGEVTGRIARIEPLTPDIFEVSVELERPLDYGGGQYVVVSAAETDIPPRCYSFARPAASADRRVCFCVRLIEGGRMSTWLTDTRHIGQPVTLAGPQGDFFLRDLERPAVCVAGGSGLAPILALLEQAVAHDAGIVRQPLALLFGVRRRCDLFAVDRITHLQRVWQGDFVFESVLSAESASSPWAGARGMVTERIATHVRPGAVGYVCGPPPMVEAARARLLDHGVAREHIFSDAFADQSAAG